MYFSLKFLLTMVIIFMLGQLADTFVLYQQGFEALAYATLIILLFALAGAILLVIRMHEDKLDKLEEI